MTNEAMLRALDGSILKWEKIVEGTGVDEGPSNCPLCQLYYDTLCRGCPVPEKAGDRKCKGTPYVAWAGWKADVDHYDSLDELNDPKLRARGTELAQAELDFLKELKEELLNDQRTTS